MTHSDTFPLRGQSVSWALPRAIAAVGGDADGRRSRRVSAPSFRPSVRASHEPPAYRRPVQLAREKIKIGVAIFHFFDLPTRRSPRDKMSRSAPPVGNGAGRLWEELLMRKPKIYLDNCSYNRPFDNQKQMKVRLETEAKLFIQASVREGKYSLCWSFMLDYENGKNPYEEKRSMIAPWKEIAEDYCPPLEVVLSRGQEIMKRGIKNNDALHISCAIERQCEYFITTDDKLTNKTIPNIRIINPIDFVREMEA